MTKTETASPEGGLDARGYVGVRLHEYYDNGREGEGLGTHRVQSGTGITGFATSSPIRVPSMLAPPGTGGATSRRTARRPDGWRHLGGSLR